MPRPTSQDLAGFWDLLQLSIDDVSMKFDQLQQIKNNNWRPMDSPEKKVRSQTMLLHVFLFIYVCVCVEVEVSFCGILSENVQKGLYHHIWIILSALQPPAPVPKKTVRQKSVVTREKSLDLPDRHRQEARRRLMAAKRAASFRQNSASERADSIEIYIPEAQTRLWENEGSGADMSPCSRILTTLQLAFFLDRYSPPLFICFPIAILSAHRQYHWTVGCAKALLTLPKTYVWHGLVGFFFSLGSLVIMIPSSQALSYPGWVHL